MGKIWTKCSVANPDKSGEYLVGISYISAYDELQDQVVSARGTSLAMYDKETNTWHHPFANVEMWMEKFDSKTK